MVLRDCEDVPDLAGVQVIRLSAARLSRAARAENRAGFLADASRAQFTPDITTEVRTESADATTPPPSASRRAPRCWSATG